MLLTEVPGPSDEANHLAYIESIAAGDGIPRVGESFVAEEIRLLMRRTPTGLGRYFPDDVSDPRAMGPAAEQYEAIQPPLYYFAMAIPFRLASPGGLLAALYSVRLFTLLTALAAVPLTWLLAKELFPQHPAVWLLSPALLVMVNGFNSTLVAVSNDTLVVPMTVAALWLMARGRRELTWKGAVTCGAVLGLCLLTKSNTVALFLFLPLVLMPSREAHSLKQRIFWVGTATGVAALLLIPWLIWNAAAYGSVGGGGKIASEIIGGLVPSYPLSFEGVIDHFQNAKAVFWQFRNLGGHGERYGQLFFGAALFSLCAGLFTAWRRGQWAEMRSLAWLAAVWPAVFLTMTVIVYIAYAGSIVGRHMFPAMVPLVIVIAAGMVMSLGPRFGALTLCGLVAVALSLERRDNRAFIHTIYTPNLVAEGFAPVYDQQFNSGWVKTSGFRVSSRCPVSFMAVSFEHPAPLEIAIEGEQAVRTARLIGESRLIAATYELPKPYPKDFDVKLPAPAMVGASAEGSTVAFIDAPGFPMAQIHCRVGAPAEVRWAQVFGPNHPDWMSYRLATWWGDFWAVAGAALLVSASLVLGIRARRSPQNSVAPPSARQRRV